MKQTFPHPTNYPRVVATYLIVLCVLLCTTAVHAQTMVTGAFYRSFFPKDDPYCSASGEVMPLTQVRTSVNEAASLAAGLFISQGTRTPCQDVALPSDTVLPESVIDWVLVELRRADTVDIAAQNPQTSVVARKPAFLLENGRIVDAEAFVSLNNRDISACANVDENANCPAVSFGPEAFGSDEVPTVEGNTYVVVRHRNHLDIISSQPMAFDSNRVASYDFTVAADRVRGGFNAVNEAEPDYPGVWMMVAGDVNGNGNIEFVRDASEWIYREIGKTGYFYSDLNMNGDVEVRDSSAILFPNLGKTSGVFH